MMASPYEVAAEMFLKKYKEYVVNWFKQPEQSERLSKLLQENNFARTLNNLTEKCTIYENGDMHSKVLETLDLDLIYANVDKMPLESEEQYSDNLVKELLRYFKQDFFSWCNKPDCHNCGASGDDIRGVGSQRPTWEEAKYRCGVVEVYKCNKCGSDIRFPRYGDSLKLLETRTGRCGEWADLFTLILKSFGLETRYIWNREDHVWCEYYSPHLKRWVHVDSCEQSFDQPYIYSINWNKKMSYCIAFGSYDVVDVSKRYILQNQLPRDLISEDDLQFLCQSLTKRVRSGLSDDEKYKLFCRDDLERIELDPTSATKTEKRMQELSLTDTSDKGRISGSAEWKAQRGEDGK
ncbi:Peptide-N(4)-(N-acetyl-beta-glucosaminyl)asparagine amidase [Nakaseomyces bracarensis]|uniref:Peptide:N-glycanase 1 n=1 Tax=Nakaseomyces bracarensis TaxID=273131 RepID=A0ABR4NU45_9SACH